MNRLALACAVALLSPQARAGEAWVDLPPLPTPRQEVGVAALEGVVYAVGGITADRAPSAVVERYHPQEARWERAADLPRALHHLGLAALGGKLYSIGGLDARFAGTASCFEYDPGADAWREVAPLPTRRGAAGVAEVGGKIYAAGGQDRSSTVADFAAFEPGMGGGQWEALPQMPTARNHLAAAAAAGRFYALSGRSSELRQEVEEYDPEAREWRARKPIPTPRGGIAAAAIGKSIFVFGGEGNDADPAGVFPQCERFDVAADAWETRLDMSLPRHGIGAAVVGDTVFIPGGARVEGFSVTGASTAYLPPAQDLPPFRRGDASPDGSLDILDPLRILFHLFTGGPALPCPDAADFDDTGSLAVSDAVALLELIFLAGAPPPAPLAAESGDPTPDLLGCSELP